jgi:hypothetical protein
MVWFSEFVLNDKIALFLSKRHKNKRLTSGSIAQAFLINDFAIHAI